MADTTILATGQVSNTTGNLYSPSGVSATIVRVEYFDGTGANIIKTYMKESGGTARQVRKHGSATAPVDSAYEYMGPATLQDGDAVQADATNASQVNFAVHGYEHN